MNYRQYIVSYCELILIILSGYFAIIARSGLLENLFSNSLTYTPSLLLILCISILTNRVVNLAILETNFKVFQKKSLALGVTTLEVLIDLFLAATLIFILKEKVFSRSLLGLFLLIKFSTISSFRLFFFNYVFNFFEIKFSGKTNPFVIDSSKDLPLQEATITEIAQGNYSNIEILIDSQHILETIKFINAIEELGKKITINYEKIKTAYTISIQDAHKINLDYIRYSFPLMLFKTLTDICLSLIGIMLFILAYLILYFPIKISTRRSVLFKQKRMGLNGHLFEIYKFRTMTNKKNISDVENEIAGPAFKNQNDPRITRIGKFLRKSSIDELPQFINVLKGEMSVIGPRPPTPEEVKLYQNSFYKRMSVRPGITGFWQVHSRKNTTNFEQIMNDDLYYLKHASVYLDIKIILKTLGAIIKLEGK